MQNHSDFAIDSPTIPIRGIESMSEKNPECPLYNPLNCKEYYNPKLCAFVRKDKICLKKKKPRPGKNKEENTVGDAVGEEKNDEKNEVENAES